MSQKSFNSRVAASSIGKSSISPSYSRASGRQSPKFIFKIPGYSANQQSLETSFPLRLEDRLMALHSKSQIRIKQQQEMLKDKEMEYVKGNPEINPLSRFLIENQISYDEVEKILKNAGLENSSYKTQVSYLNKLKEQQQDTSQNQDISVVSNLIQCFKKAKNRNQQANENNVMEKIFKAAQEWNDDQSDVVHMDTFQRTYFWNEMRKQKVALIQKEKRKEQMKQCTFSPKLSPKRHLSQSSCSDLLQQTQRTYTQLHKQKTAFRSQEASPIIKKKKVRKSKQRKPFQDQLKKSSKQLRGRK